MHFILVLCLGCVVIFLTVQFYFANNFSDNFSSELHNNFTSVSVFFINSITCNFILLLTVFLSLISQASQAFLLFFNNSCSLATLCTFDSQ